MKIEKYPVIEHLIRESILEIIKEENYYDIKHLNKQTFVSEYLYEALSYSEIRKFIHANIVISEKNIMELIRGIIPTDDFVGNPDEIKYRFLTDKEVNGIIKHNIKEEIHKTNLKIIINLLYNIDCTCYVAPTKNNIEILDVILGNEDAKLNLLTFTGTLIGAYELTFDYHTRLNYHIGNVISGLENAIELSNKVKRFDFWLKREIREIKKLSNKLNYIKWRK